MAQPDWEKILDTASFVMFLKPPSAPSYMFNFASVISHYATIMPTKVALSFGETSLTYEELDRSVSTIAKGMQDLGLRNGDIVSILLYNCPEFIEVALACNRLGAVFLPLNYRLAGEEIKYILQDSQAKMLVTEKEFQETIDSVRGAIPSLEHCVTVDGLPSKNWANLHNMAELHEGVRVSDFEVDLEDLHRLMYTSGTTAHPKGVMINYGNLYWKNIAHIIELNLTENDVYLVAGPLYHAGALDLCSTCVIHAGGSLVIIRKFDTLAVFEAIARHKVSITWFAPSMINMLLNNQKISEYDLSSVRIIINGGEKMPESFVRKIQDHFPNVWIADSYGLTETVSGDTFLDKESAIRKLGSVGRPVIHLQARVVDAMGNDVKTGEVGEIILRGPKVFKGYWKNADATREAFSDGWFHTGDAGRIDEDGYLYIVDRIKDMIISGGENVASLEVERVLYEHPSVLEAAVVAMPDSRWGEVPAAYVVQKKDKTASKEELTKFCSERLAKFKVPRQIVFLDALPRNPSGKVLKRLLRNMKST